MKINKWVDRLALVSLFALVLTGCTPHEGARPVTSVGTSTTDDSRYKTDPNKVDIQYDEFTKATSYFGTTHTDGRLGEYGIIGESVFLSLWRSPEESVYLLNVAATYGGDGFHMFDGAIDISGAKLSAYDSKRDVHCSGGSCTYEEIILLLITRQDIEDRINTGFRFRLEGRYGSQEIKLPAEYVRGFLAKVPAA